MTNYERIVNLSVRELADFIEQVDCGSHLITDSKYCEEACEHKEGGRHGCPFADDVELPCLDMKPIECITAWLNTEAVEHDK